MEYEDLILLRSSTEELINTYNYLEPLLYSDVPGALIATAKNSRRNTKLRSMNSILGKWTFQDTFRGGATWYSMNQLAFGVKGDQCHSYISSLF